MGEPRESFYREALAILDESGIDHLVGGAFALATHAGIERDTKDLDVFVRPEDWPRVLDEFAGRGYRTELTFPHWLGKVFSGDHLLDVIFGSGNGLCAVDDGWFEHAVPGRVLDLPARLVPAEEMIWSKGFIMERERYDGADVLHVLRARAQSLDWRRLLDRFGEHWRVLLSHLFLFGFVYPGERSRVPRRVMDELLDRLRQEGGDREGDRPCYGTFLSRAQYRVDIDAWGYLDPRLEPVGGMSAQEVSRWDQAAP